jgi:hypothetical protein
VGPNHGREATPIAIFVTCILDQLFPNAGMAMATVLNASAFRLIFRKRRRVVAARVQFRVGDEAPHQLHSEL